MKTKTMFVVLAVLALTLPLSVSAQTHSVVVNGDFQTGAMTPWTGSGSVVDIGGGDYALMHNGMGIFSTAQCIDIETALLTWPTVGGKQYLTAGVDVNVGGVSFGPPTLSFYFYTDTACTTDETLGGSASRSDTGSLTATGEIPAGTRSLKVTLGSQFVTAPLYWDNVVGYSSGPTAVTLNSLAARNGSAAMSLGLAGLFTFLGVAVFVIARKKKAG